MKVVFTPRAEEQLASQFAYGIEKFGRSVATRTLKRLRSFVRSTIARYPPAAKYHASRDVYESWVPGTPFVVVYRLEREASVVRVVAVFHSSQDRADM